MTAPQWVLLLFFVPLPIIAMKGRKGTLSSNTIIFKIIFPGDICLEICMHH